MNFDEVKYAFWDLETNSQDQPENVAKIITEYLDQATLKEQNAVEAATLIDSIFNNYSFSKTEKRQIRAAQINLLQSGRRNGRVLAYAYEILSNYSNEKIIDDTIITATKTLLRFGMPIDASIIESIQSPKEKRHKKLLFEIMFLKGELRDQNVKIDDAFFQHFMESLISAKIDPLLKYSRGETTLTMLENLLLWLMHMLTVRENDRKKIPSPERLRKTTEKSQMTSEEHSLLTHCIKLQALLKSHAPSIEDQSQLISDTEKLPTRLSEILSLSVILRHNNIQDLPSRAWISSLYQSSQQAYYPYANPDLFLVNAQNLDLKSSVFRSNKAFRSLKTIRAGSKPFTNNVLSRAASYFSNAKSSSEKRHEEFIKDLDGFGIRVRDLRGGIAKVFQLGLATEGVFPEEFKKSLEGSFDRCNAMPVNQTQQVFKESMGATPEEIFATWDRTPFACGSIGQVHNAVTKDGKKVCVKVRYKDIEKAVQNDFDSLGLVMAIFPKLLPATNMKTVIKEWKKVTLDECNYKNELQHMNNVYDILKDSQVIVPRAYPELSSDSIITMDKIDGRRFADFCYVASRNDRDRVGRQLLESSLELLKNGYYRMDVHQGNYLVVSGNLAMIDLANMATPGEEKGKYLSEFLLALASKDTSLVRSILIKEGWANAQTVPDMVLEKMIQVLGEPFHSEDFLFTSEYARNVFKFSVSDQLQGLRLPLDAMPSLRLFWSTYGLLGALRARGNWLSIVKSLTQDKNTAGNIAAAN